MLGEAVLVFYLYLLLGAAFAVYSSFRILVRREVKINFIMNEMVGIDDPTLHACPNL